MRLPSVLTALGLLTAAVAPLHAERPAAENDSVRARFETSRVQPKAYGTKDYSITSVPAMAFFPASSSETYVSSGEYGRRGALNTRMQFYAPIQLPDGIIIDYVGFNSQTDAPDAIGVALNLRTQFGNVGTILDFSSPSTFGKPITTSCRATSPSGTLPETRSCSSSSRAFSRLRSTSARSKSGGDGW